MFFIFKANQFVVPKSAFFPARAANPSGNVKFLRTSGSPYIYMRRNPYMRRTPIQPNYGSNSHRIFGLYIRRTPIQPNYGSNSHRIFGDAFFFRVLPFENFFGFCENGGHDWAFTQKSMQFLALCQGCSGSILLWKSISSQQVAIFMPKTHLAYQSLQSAAAFLPNVCQQNQ